MIMGSIVQNICYSTRCGSTIELEQTIIITNILQNSNHRKDVGEGGRQQIEWKGTKQF